MLGRSWAEQCHRRGQVSRLTGAAATDLLTTIDDLPVTAPIVIGYHVTAELDGSSFVDAVLADLRRVVIALFPTWLPGGDDTVTGRTELDLAGALAIAQRLSRASTNFGPFVSDMVRVSFDEDTAIATYAREVEIAGLVRLLAAGYLRRDIGLLITTDPALPAARHTAIAHACEWLATHGPMCVWLADDAIGDVDRFPTESIGPLAGNLLDLGSGSVSGAPDGHSTDRTRIVAPVVEGMPAPHSAAENHLERRLEHCDWAHGRAWNSTTPTGSKLHQTVRTDLAWHDARVVVEIDGADHRTPAKYATDRLRDNLLQRSGFLVLRYTNEQVLDDPDLVTAELHDVLTERRPALTASESHRGTSS